MEVYRTWRWEVEQEVLDILKVSSAPETSSPLAKLDRYISYCTNLSNYSRWRWCKKISSSIVGASGSNSVFQHNYICRWWRWWSISRTTGGANGWWIRWRRKHNKEGQVLHGNTPPVSPPQGNAGGGLGYYQMGGGGGGAGAVGGEWITQEVVEMDKNSNIGKWFWTNSTIFNKCYTNTKSRRWCRWFC